MNYILLEKQQIKKVKTYHAIGCFHVKYLISDQIAKPYVMNDYVTKT